MGFHMRITVLLFVALLSSVAWADDQLWEKLKTEPNLVVLMRHTHSTGGHPLTWTRPAIAGVSLC